MSYTDWQPGTVPGNLRGQQEQQEHERRQAEGRSQREAAARMAELQKYSPPPDHSPGAPSRTQMHSEYSKPSARVIVFIVLLVVAFVAFGVFSLYQ